MLAATLSQPVTANSPVTQIHAGDIPKGTVGLGMGLRWGDSPYRGIPDISSTVTDEATDLLPYYYYNGRYLFAQGSEFGVHLFERENFVFDVLGSYRFTRLEPERRDYFRTVEARRQSLDGGLRGSFRGEFGKLSLMALHGALDRHNGLELDLTYRFDWQPGRWVISPFVSYLYQDEDLTDYYFGVSEPESRPDLPVYQPGSSQFARIGVNTTFRWSKRMRLFANYQHDFLPSEVRDSPLVGRDSTGQLMLGLAYGFGNTLDENEIRRRNPDRAGEWSWRVNYGYTAQETFVKVHTGHIRENEDVDTYLAGLTLGKLLLNGPRADYWAKVSVNRRLEEGLQEDFWEINPYVMVKGTGYSPWSSRELFRYGFGYGFSYADKIPAVEQVKQAKRGENTSRFLNYLEAQVDMPLRNLFGRRGWWRDCYAGLTLVHRSGIFGKVDILNNVAGGSDVLTAHLECVRK